MSTANEQQQQEEREFDEAYAKFSGGKPGDSAAAPADTPAEDDEDATNDGEPKPAEQPGQAAAAAAEEDPLRDAPEHIRSYVGKLQSTLDEERAARQTAEHSARSNAGRVGALTKKVEALQKTTRTDGPGGKDNPAPGGEGDDPGESFGQDFPQVDRFVRETVEKAVLPLKETLAEKEAAEKEGQRLAAEAAARDHRNRELARLRAVHSDFEQIRQSQEYGQWLQSQPPGIRALQNSVHADDAIHLTTLFKQSTGKKPGGVSRADLVAGAAQPRSQGAPRGGGVPDDFDQAFDHYARKLTQT